MKLTGMTATAILMGALPTAALAQDMEPIFLKYHMAIATARACRGIALSDRDWRIIAAFLDRRTHFELGAGLRLELIEEAQGDARYYLFRQGCAGEEPADLLALFDRDLAPLLR